MTATGEDYLSLLDWRRQIHRLYADVRVRWRTDPADAHALWRARRDVLFAEHPQSPLAPDERERFGGLAHFPYSAGAVFAAEVEPTEPERLEIGTSTGGSMAFERIGIVHLALGSLDVYWLDAYGGGLFLPFRDATSGAETYGGGRYLLDTAKGADLGVTDRGSLVLDLNFAYSPSCHYNPVWTCPLAPPGSRLAARVEAGELRYPGAT